MRPVKRVLYTVINKGKEVNTYEKVVFSVGIGGFGVWIWLQ
jgi:hypothetical protein